MGIKSNMAFLCGPRLYKFDGWFFEFSAYSGPWPLKIDGEPRKRAGRNFYKMFGKFTTMSEEKQETYKVGGGCHRF